MNESLPIVIQDLAYILIVAGITTVLFKKLKQPLVLGYIISGFLAGPHMPYMPTIGDVGACNNWGQIGVIFIMFTLGLEFSFKKIVKMGISPVLCVCMIMASMIGIGNAVGNLFGWSDMDSLFLGGMLSMSSTTIIYKAYDEMQLSHKKFAGTVLSVLILEDIMGILLMVVLSTIAATRQFEGTALINSLVSLGTMLILWFTVGIFVLPLLFKRYKRYMNQETLMIVSLALCFILVILSNKAGYSPAFGAFMMGSILAETVEAEQIEKSVGPIKDFFGAIFFVSVGMMVSPNIVVQYWMIIVVLVFTIIFGQTIFGTLSYLVTGSSLKDSIYSGFSMTQIGEFAFIIASVGEGLGVTSPKLYPIVVAVSIITTFLTPYMIKAATPVCNFINNHINADVEDGIGFFDSLSSHTISDNRIKAWKRLLTALLYQTVAYSVIAYTFVGVSLAILKPIFNHLFNYLIKYNNIGHWIGNCITAIIIIVCISPFLRAICIRKNHSNEAKFICSQNKFNTIMFQMTFVIRFIICAAIIYTVIDYQSPFSWKIHIPFCVLVLCIMLKSRLVKMVSIKIERIFKQNLTRRENLQKGPGYARMLKGQDLHLTRLVIPELSLWSGMSLSELNLGQNNGVHIAAIVRGRLRINIPGGENKIFSGDILELVGDDDSIESVRQNMIQNTTNIENYPPAEPLKLKKLIISGDSRLVGHTLIDSNIRSQFHCTVIGFEDNEGNLIQTDPHRKIVRHDTIWVVGEYENLELLELITNPPFSINNGEINIK